MDKRQIYKTNLDKLVKNDNFSLKFLLENLEYSSFNFDRYFLLEDILNGELNTIVKIFKGIPKGDEDIYDTAILELCNLSSNVIKANENIFNKIFILAVKDKNQTVIENIRILLFKHPSAISIINHLFVLKESSYNLSIKNRITLAVALSFREDLLLTFEWENIDYSRYPEFIPALLDFHKNGNHEYAFRELSYVERIENTEILFYISKYLEVFLLTLIARKIGLKDLLNKYNPHGWFFRILADLTKHNRKLRLYEIAEEAKINEEDLISSFSFDSLNIINKLSQKV